MLRRPLAIVNRRVRQYALQGFDQWRWWHRETGTLFSHRTPFFVDALVDVAGDEGAELCFLLR